MAIDYLQELRDYCETFEGSTMVFQGECFVYKTYGKVFSLVDEERKVNVSLKADPEALGDLLDKPHIIPAPYMWHNGWVNITVSNRPTCDECKKLIATSHALVLAKVPKSKRT